MPKRINRCIDLLEAGHTIYYTGAGELTYENGKKQSQTWADFLIVDFEKDPFDVVGLNQFMQGIVDGGPTPDGYRMATVLATLPSNAKTRVEVEANAWQVRHVLSAGVHGILHTHARQADAVQAFVEQVRWPFQTIGVGRDGGLGQGQRGAGGQAKPAQLWGLTPQEYVKVSDPWPLNPDGEIMLGLKLEDRECVANAEFTAAVPGISFAEWGPGDMGMSYGYSDAHDPPYPEEVDRARLTVRAACDKAGIRFLCSWHDPEKTEEENLRFLLDWGVKIVSGGSAEVKKMGLRIKPRD
ncbi:MAG: hypothetical protein IIC92_05355 [Chloroflexi bacterium]|nr:hypothetical protein [Chloroflexota bacterium]MCH8817139.1 hypothetical protein [Chloroflexota bacterium]